MSGQNGDRGNYRSSLENYMRAFDKLPPAARRALADAVVGNWATQPLLTRYRRGDAAYSTGDEIASTIRRWDQRELAERERQRALAIGPYKGNAPDNPVKTSAPARRKR